MTYTKRAVALLLALMMVFTGAVQAFAATQMTMAVIALPRAADTNKGDWGPQRCVRRLEHFRSNDDVEMLKSMLLEAVGMLLGLRNIIVEATPIKDLPSCKRLTELSTGDAISAINDLGKNCIVKTVVCAGLLGKNIADRIEISDVEKFYMLQIEELNRELADEKREMCDIEVFLMAKYQAELGYCHQARVKTGIGIVNEIVGIIKNADEVIGKYENRISNTGTTQFLYGK